MIKSSTGRAFPLCLVAFRRTTLTGDKSCFQLIKSRTSRKQYDFQAINVSVEGLMIRLAETIIIAQGITTAFEFKSLNLKGEAQVVWMDIDSEGKTLVGLKYINMNTDKITGIPSFAC